MAELIHSGHRFQCLTTNLTGDFLHLHKEVELLYIIKGSANITINSQEYKINTGDFILVFPYRVHKVEGVDSLHYLLCTFDVDILPFFSHLFTQFIIQGAPIRNVGEMPKEVCVCMNEILSRKELQKESNITFGYLTIILEHLLSGFNLEKVTYTKEQDWIFRVIAYLNNNFRQSIRLDKMSEELHLNKYFISRNFKQNTGCSIEQYIHFLRLEHAKNLLIFTEDTITDIAFDSGFENISTFYRVFKNNGLGSPQKFRKQEK